jgi:hypothetical protein
MRGQMIAHGWVIAAGRLLCCHRMVLTEVQVHFGSVLVVIWLIIGAIAAGQRGYFNGPVGSCTKASTIALTILAGPLNYAGVNPKISCILTVRPSR